MTSREIAQQIEALAECCIHSEITAEQCSAETKALWTQAKELGVESEVDTLLQEWSTREMEAAIARQEAVHNERLAALGLSEEAFQEALEAISRSACPVR